MSLKVCHIITGLNDGGAESVLFRLCANDQKAEHIVISLMDEGKYGPLLVESGVRVYCLGMSPGRLRLGALNKLRRLLRKIRPDVVQTWMYHSDLLGGTAARLAGIKKVFWGVRHTDLSPDTSKLSTRIVNRLNALLSHYLPLKIICCAESARQVHKDLGYAEEKLCVIANGYDLSRFRPATSSLLDLRAALKISDEDLLLGTVGRFHPQKDHFCLLESLSILKKRISNFSVLLVGPGLSSDNTLLVKHISALDLKQKIFLLGPRSNIQAVMSQIDIHVLSSCAGEAFPNVLAEAMACGTPCITTDVGDASFIVGESGWVVPPRDPPALAAAMIDAIKEKQDNPEAWLKRKEQARKRITDNFSLEKMIESYHQVWRTG